MTQPAKADLLFVSNGHGEDAIAAEIIRRLPRGLLIEAYPIIGSGSAYAPVCHVIGPRSSVPSQGWRNTRFSLLQDIAAGGVAVLPRARNFLKTLAGRHRQVVVVGDMLGVYLSHFAGLKDIVYLDVYKTGFGGRYSAIDRTILRRATSIVFSRHKELAQSLRNAGIDARTPGNIMMDTVPFGTYDTAARRRRTHAITLLPGSRHLTKESFSLQVRALEALPSGIMPDVFAAIADSVDLEELARATRLRRTGPLTGDADDMGSLSSQRLHIHLARGTALGNLLDTSDFVLSQAGTATVQAIGLGRPAITFRNRRDRASRFRAESALFADGRLVVPADADAVVQAMTLLLTDDAERLRRGDIGRQRIGPPGAISQILPSIAADLFPDRAAGADAR